MNRYIRAGAMLLSLSLSAPLFDLAVLAQQPTPPADDAQAAPTAPPNQSGDNADVVAEIQQLKADVDRLNQEVDILNNEIKSLQGSRSSPPRVPRTAPASAVASSSAPATSTSSAPPLNTSSSSEDENTPITILVFRDGRKVQTRNYAIIGDSIWVYTEQESRKYRVADLDVDATKKVNSENGVGFQLPPTR